MKWTYDPSVDALMITLLPGKRSKRAEELRPGLICDYDDVGHPISIELLEASSYLPLKNLESLPLPGRRRAVVRAKKTPPDVLSPIELAPIPSP